MQLAIQSDHPGGVLPRCGDVFGEVLAHLRSVLAPAWHAHASTYDASCARCLRDYSNAMYHPLLDWRLALDMVKLLQDPSHVPDLHSPGKTFPNPWTPLVQGPHAPIPAALAQLGYLPVALHEQVPAFQMHTRRGDCTLLVAHPLWTPDHPALAQAQAALPEDHDVRVVSVFRLLRRPSDAL